MPTPDPAELDRAADLLRGRRFAVLTGAGVSTDSGIPDYRGPGAPVRKPMTGPQFRASAESRRRYWAGAFLGGRLMGAARPNASHDLLAGWERSGILLGIATQNVDGLHRQAGTRKLVELHGGLDRVVCLDCEQGFARQAITDQIARENPWLAQLGPEDSDRLNPDGDAEVPELDGFVVPVCTVCGGVLKPDVVFFGETVPTARFARARSIVHRADALLVLGSSLTVNTGIRLLDQARRDGSPIITINRGVTGGASRAALVIEGSVAPALAGLGERLG
ncbi:NAD-dependent deacetylase [Mycetocola tolaasinivorans]|uniref:protein acetyllysine N-acetyltransferase n=1 Tax=Mycetocola tolaasinivorans TaxID=76635 RepID=A0A3L7A311_9MICO|nr:Sir2 family NAD-dependent protein deacetylase [Mycetocola tolaasinivorans]RLP74308.1 NAD-dependent deacetylase [Mycetocola tolaasinivorans]